MSPGKNYIASKFLTVNSEAWWPLTNGRFEKIGYLNTGLVYSGPNGSMRPPLRLSHAEMPWTGKFDEALKGCINKHRTLGRLLHYYGKDVREHTRGGALNLFAKVEQGGLGIALPPGIEPGWTWYQRSLAHHLRHQLVERVNQSVTLGVDLNILVGLPPDFTFQPEIESPAAASAYATPKPPAKASARWLRSYGRWRTNWSLVPVWQPCGQFEHRVKDLAADEPTFLSYSHGSSLNHGGSTIVFRRPT